jgi:hypothetical protein
MEGCTEESRILTPEEKRLKRRKLQRESAARSRARMKEECGVTYRRRDEEAKKKHNERMRRWRAERKAKGIIEIKSPRKTDPESRAHIAEVRKKWIANMTPEQKLRFLESKRKSSRKKLDRIKNDPELKQRYSLRQKERRRILKETNPEYFKFLIDRQNERRRKKKDEFRRNDPEGYKKFMKDEYKRRKQKYREKMYAILNAPAKDYSEWKAALKRAGY